MFQKEYEKDLKRTLDTHPCVQKLKENYMSNNEQLIFKQKMGLLQRGQAFPKLPIEKVRLHDNFDKY